MLTKFKDNQNKIFIVLSIIAGALLVPDLLELLTNEFYEAAFFELLSKGGLLTINILFAVFAEKNKFNKAFKALFIIMYSLLIASELYQYTKIDDIYCLSYIVLYIAIIVIYAISANNPNLKNVLCICLLVQSAFLLVEILSVKSISITAFSMSLLITVFINTTNIYLLNE